jgi:hypothetical protein
MKSVKLTTFMLANLVCALLLVTQVHARGGHHTMNIQYASYTLDDTVQDVDFGTIFTFNEDESSAVGGEYLYYFSDVNAIGATVLFMSHEYNSGIGSGDIDHTMLLFSYKAHAPIADWFRPFLNLSVGITAGDVSGAYEGSVAGFAAGGGIGIYMPFSNHVGLTAEYRKLVGTLYDSADFEFDFGGDMVMGGVTIIF